MTAGEKPPETVVKPYVRWFLMGLPLGLVVLGALSFVFYFHKRHLKVAAAAAPSRYAAMLRKDVNLDDYRRHLRIFEHDIGPRTPDKPQNIEAAQSFIESTLGFGNMGYQPVRREIERDGMKGAHIEVELPGRRSVDHLVLVTAAYDGTRAEDIAALLVLAQAFTGTQHRSTIRFVALGAGAHPSADGIPESYKEWLPSGASPPAARFKITGPPPEAPDAIEQLRRMEQEISRLADAPVAE